jgi:CheY-like chemotaxis protein
MTFDAASVNAGPGASLTASPGRAQALPAETRSPRRLPTAASALEECGYPYGGRALRLRRSRHVTVLIVDDHPSFRATARALLEAEGFHVVGEAEDGASALRAAQELEPQLVLLDVQLPDIDGFEVAQRLTDGGGPIVVLVSSRDGSDFGSLVERSGARGFIAKGELSGAALSALLG